MIEALKAKLADVKLGDPRSNHRAMGPLVSRAQRDPRRDRDAADRGPLLANYGLDNLRFLKPVSPDDSIRVKLTVKQKSSARPEYGEVRWDVEVVNQHDEPVARYDLLTMSAKAT